MSEQLNPAGRERWIILGAGFTVLTLAGVIIAHNDATNPWGIYMERYTDDGECLDGTPYDPDMGASLALSEIEGQKIITVTGMDPSSTDPSELHLVAAETGYFSLELRPADYLTGGVLADRCGYTDGY
jgi:hypothetical protein